MQTSHIGWGSRAPRIRGEERKAEERKVKVRKGKLRRGKSRPKEDLERAPHGDRKAILNERLAEVQSDPRRAAHGLAEEFPYERLNQKGYAGETVRRRV